jgi:copper(I)-binding protein
MRPPFLFGMNDTMRKARKTMRRTLTLIVLVTTLAAGACSSTGDGIVVEDPWGRTSPKVTANGAFYMILVGGEEADRLVAADTDACGTVELHQTIMNDGVMTMQPAEGGIEIPAEGEAVLEPGGYHVMCIDKTQEFEVGDVIPLTLTFDQADSQTVDVEIREG